MILVIAGRGTARTLRRAPQAHGPAGDDDVRVLEPAGLSVPGWVHDPHHPRADLMVIDGAACPAGRLTAVRDALGEVTPQDLPHVGTADREFVAAEMSAFLRSWLAGLDCPVTGHPLRPGQDPFRDPARDQPARDQPGSRSARARDGGGRPVVLLWGAPEEPPLAAVHRALLARGADVVLVDQRRALATRLAGPPGSPVLTLPGRTLPLALVTAAYPRPYPFLPEVPAGRPARGVALRHAARLARALWQWADDTDATVVNRPGPSASNNTKPLQTRAAARCGFAVPESLLTNDPQALREFARRHGPVIYKGASGTRTRPALLDPADTARLSRLATCPVYFQRYVKGTNTRVHVVGQDIFASEIDTGAVDYRAEPLDMRQVTLPGDVAARCLAVTRELGLPLAGIDLIRDPAGEWYFLEANPSPGFTFFPAADQVAEAIARLLTSREDGVSGGRGASAPGMQVAVGPRGSRGRSADG